MAVFGPFPSGRVGGRQLRFLLGPGGWASISFFVRAGWVGVEILPGARWASPVFFRILPRAKLRNPIPILMELRVIQG